MVMTEDRTGKKVRVVLIGNRYYSGIIKNESDLVITLIDKFGSEVSIGKNALISLEVLA
jgi:hypothetical protein